MLWGRLYSGIFDKLLPRRQKPDVSFTQFQSCTIPKRLANNSSQWVAVHWFNNFWELSHNIHLETYKKIWNENKVVERFFNDHYKLTGCHVRTHTTPIQLKLCWCGGVAKRRFQSFSLWSNCSASWNWPSPKTHSVFTMLFCLQHFLTKL